MKKLLFILCLLPFIGNAQIREIKVKAEETRIGKVPNIECVKVDDNYVFRYSDTKYVTSKVMQSFAIPGSDFETLYTKLVEAFNLSDKEIMHLDLPNNRLMIDKIRFAGIPCIRITNVDKASNVMSMAMAITKNQLAKLFGKS